MRQCKLISLMKKLHNINKYLLFFEYLKQLYYESVLSPHQSNAAL